MAANAASQVGKKPDGQEGGGIDIKFGAIGWLTAGGKWQILPRRKVTMADKQHGASGLNDSDDLNEEGTAWENNGGVGDLNK